jgi:hypothetical protein
MLAERQGGDVPVVSAPESLYRKLKIGTSRFCQFRRFDASESKQAKGALKAMSDRV